MKVKDYLDITKSHYGYSINIDNQGYGNYTNEDLNKEIKCVEIDVLFTLALKITTYKERRR